MKLKQFELEVPDEEYLPSGHLGCAGCAGAAGLRYALKVLGPRVIVVLPSACSSVFTRPITDVTLCRCAFGAGAAMATGVRAALDMKGDMETEVLAFVGDGGTFDIGLQALSSAVERNEDIIWICYDNEGYMNTGIQRSSATPFGAWTTTTPRGLPKEEPKKNMTEILAAHRIPYAATVSVAYPQDMIRKMNKARSANGTSFIHLLAPCPTGWRFSPRLTVKISRLAVQSKVFPLYEVEHGLQYRVQRPTEEVPVRDYLTLQGRFSHLNGSKIEIVQKNADQEWERLLAKTADFTYL